MRRNPYRLACWSFGSSAGGAIFGRLWSRLDTGPSWQTQGHKAVELGVWVA